MSREMEMCFRKEGSRLRNILTIVLWFGCLSSADEQLQCYNCTNIASIDDCDFTTTCGPNEHCFTEVKGELGNRTFNSGCRTETECLALKPDPSTSIIGKRFATYVCNQCCGVSLCNNKICAKINSVTGSFNGICEDDPTFGCERVSGLLNLCADVVHAKTVCRKFCGLCNVVDGDWSNWTSWSTCSVTCDSGTSARSRTCTNPAPAHGGQDCIGQNSETQPCLKQHCPVHGGWSRWSPWCMCSVSCGMGMQIRDRKCSSPYPSLGGDHCFGDSRDDRACFVKACTDGGWSIWSSWDSCSAICGPGIIRRARQCTNPAPSTFGRECQGDAHDVKQCLTFTKCTNGGWSSWSSWNLCSVTCGPGIRNRQRQCDNPTPSPFGRECQGDANDLTLCYNPKSCNPINGFWTQWSTWEMGFAGMGCYLFRSRTCIGPFLGGTACSGDRSQRNPNPTQRKRSPTLCPRHNG